mgnify:CR=1 FL=1|jgi:5-methylthioadenosine/S-adenosylhomocysteine deaminase
MMGKQIYLKNGFVISMNPSRDVYESGDILIEDDKLLSVGQVDQGAVLPDAEVVDLKGQIVMPGIINSHVHLSQQLGRGLGDDVNLLTWLHERIWPYESNLTEADSYISSLACMVEQIRCGVTSIAEPGGQHVSGMAKAAAECGIRAALAQSAMDCGEGLPDKWQLSTQEMLDIQEENIKQFHNSNDGKIRVWVGLRTMFNNSSELVCGSKELADKYGVGIHMHVAEIPDENLFVKEKYGTTTVEHLNNLGVLDEKFLAVHTVWLTDREIDLFALHNVKVSHNPAAAMRVLGFAEVPKMLQKGICVSIGTDGAPSNNRMDIWDEMYLASLLQKGRFLNPELMPAEKILEMVTINGARTLLQEDEVGSLEPGKQADLCILDLDHIGSIPCHDPIANLVYANHSRNVTGTMCAGSWLLKHGKVMVVDEAELIQTAKARAADVVKRAGIHLPARF